MHDLPLRAGPLSFAVRWHGARPALLWDAPAGVELRAPALDPQWSTRERGGRGVARGAAGPVARDGIRRRRDGDDDRRPRVRSRERGWTSTDFVAAGLYDPEAADAEAAARAVRFLTDEVGASIPEIVQALEEDRLLSMAAFRAHPARRRSA